MTDLETSGLTVSDIFQAYYDCRKTKRNSHSALTFEMHLERNLMDLYHEVASGQYTPGRSICFVVEYPKVREVWAAQFRDRIVHHLLYNKIAYRFHRAFIHHSYACIPGKGIHAAVQAMQAASRSVTQNHTQRGFVLKMDVENFFVSIDKTILLGQLTARVPEPFWLRLATTVLMHDPVQNAIVKSPPSLMAKVPAHKSLFNAGGLGLPIGNLSSQFFANVYMDQLDQHAKHHLRVRHWVRYVDDIVVIGSSGSELAAIAPKVDAFIQQHLGLKLHPRKTSVQPVANGFDALGYVVRPHAKYVRRQTVQKAFRQLGGLCRSKAPANKVTPVANSYFGVLRQANTFKTRARLANLLASYGYITTHQLTKVKAA
jgi:hypothetical protein